MSTNDQDENGAGNPTNQTAEDAVKVVDVRELGTGSLVRGLVLGLLARERAQIQLGDAQHAASQNPALQADIRFHAKVKEVQETLVAAIDGSEKMEHELNVRFESIDAPRKALVVAMGPAH